MSKNFWLKAKGYIHLTDRLNVLSNRQDIYRLVTSPYLVQKHAFFPLLHKVIPQRRYKIIDYDSNNNPIRGHKAIKNGKIFSTKKLRPIHYATHIDAVIYAYYSNQILQEKYEAELKKDKRLGESIIAYRRIKVDGRNSHKNNIHFAKEVFDHIKNKGDCVALAFDIENFFTSLNHCCLKKAWRDLLGKKSLPPDHYNIFKSITRFSYINLHIFRSYKGSYDERQLASNRRIGIHSFYESPIEFRKELKNGNVRIQKNQYKDSEGRLCGIPQGLAISALLANIYLLEFDKIIINELSKIGGFYRRYSDDIAVVCDSNNWNKVEQLILNEITKYKLNISSQKTEICKFVSSENGVKSVGLKMINDIIVEDKERPFNYLGFEFNGEKILIKAKNISKFYRRMKSSVKTKVRHAKLNAVNELSSDDIIVYKRKLLRAYSEKGAKSRLILTKVSRLSYNDDLDEYRFATKLKKRKHWGNFIGYAYRASKITEEPGIFRQIRNHKSILKNSIKKELERK